MTSRVMKWGIALLAVLALLTAGIALFDWNLLKGYAEARVQTATGRQLDIGGNLDVDLGWHPRIRMERASFANTEWGSAPEKGSGLPTAVIYLVGKRSGPIPVAAGRP